MELSDILENTRETKLTPPGWRAQKIPAKNINSVRGTDVLSAKLTPQQRSEIARKAVLARWDRVKKLRDENRQEKS
jgi:hypothetical protein